MFRPERMIAVLLVLVACACKWQEPPGVGDRPAVPETKPEPEATSSEAPKEGDVPAPTDVAEPPKDAKVEVSGLATKVITPSTNKDAKKPHSFDKVQVHYTGWTTDGKMFDSSRKRGRPTTFGVKQVIPGWTEGLQLMVEGETRRMWIPKILAYKGRPGMPAGMLVFDVELIKVIAGVAPIPAPADVAAPPADARKTESGLSYKVLTRGTGKEKPRSFDKVTVNYTGWTTDGEMFDSSIKRGRATDFKVDKVIPGWTEGLQLMVEGEKTLFWIPQDLAYKGRPGPPAGMLVFEVELVKIDKQPEPPTAPKNVAAPPSSAKKTESGITYKVLKRGKGKVHPTKDNEVEVHYTGWTTDGKMFDSSVTRGKTMKFGLGRVIAGWTEGVQLMVVGDKMRFWIPEKLAYKGRRGAPAGMLVFDIELISITDAAAGKPSPHGSPPK